MSDHSSTTADSTTIAQTITSLDAVDAVDAASTTATTDMDLTASATTTSTATMPDASTLTDGKVRNLCKVANGVEFRLDSTRYWEAFDDLARIDRTTFEACMKECSMVEACTIAQYDANETRCCLIEEGFEDSRGFPRTGVAVKVVPE